MPLVMPVLPSRIFQFIGDSAASPIALESTHIANEIVSSSPAADLEFRLKICRESFVTLSAQAEEKLLRCFFAVLLLSALFYLRVHNTAASKDYLRQAKCFYRANSGVFDQAEAIEALGLVSFLLMQLEDRLARIEPCL